jgi:hypothetical protein
MNEVPDAIDQLAKRLKALEHRVEELEQSDASERPRTTPQASAPAGTLEVILDAGKPLAQGASLLSALGKAMLGIAGAYLLRAAAEAGIAPKMLMATLGIVYAILWLVLAARQPSEARLARTVYAVNSAVILGPMLWELALRFEVLPATAIAAALLAYEFVAFFSSSKPHRTFVLQAANTAVAGLALALAIATHQTLPFVVVLVIGTALCEYRMAVGRGRCVRVVVALAADLAALLLIYIYSTPQNTRIDYPILGTASLLVPIALLFLIFATAVTFSSVLKGQELTIFLSVQVTVAFLLAAASLVAFGPQSAKALLGATCLAFAAASYAATFRLFNQGAPWRNRAVFSSWSGVLFLAGSILCFPGNWTTVWLCAGALLAVAAGVGLQKTFLVFHGTAYLFAAAALSGQLNYFAHSLFGASPGSPGWKIALLSACAAASYVTASRSRLDDWELQTLELSLGALSAAALVALLVEGLVAIASAEMVLARYQLASIRTLTLCFAALALVFCGARLQRCELSRLGYATVAITAVKLFVEDLRHGHLAYVAVSIFMFALTLIAASRLTLAWQGRETHTEVT